MYFFAANTLFSILLQVARLHAIADEKVHPVPWVLGLFIFLCSNQRNSPLVYNRSSLQSFKCPPFTKMSPSYIFAISTAAFCISFLVSILNPHNHSASEIFGVIILAIGINFVISVSIASLFN